MLTGRLTSPPSVRVRWFVVVRLSPVPAGIARQGIAGLSLSRDCRSGEPERLPERIQRTKRTRTATPTRRAYPLSMARSLLFLGNDLGKPETPEAVPKDMSA